MAWEQSPAPAAEQSPASGLGSDTGTVVWFCWAPGEGKGRAPALRFSSCPGLRAEPRGFPPQGLTPLRCQALKDHTNSQGVREGTGQVPELVIPQRAAGQEQGRHSPCQGCWGGQGSGWKGKEVAGGLTFMDSDDVGVVEGRHDLDLSPDVDKVLLILDFVFPDGLDGHLQTNTHTQRSPRCQERTPQPPAEGEPPPLLGRGSLTRDEQPSSPHSRALSKGITSPREQLSSQLQL